MATSQDHNLLVKQIIIAIGSSKNIRVWQNNTGSIKIQNRFVSFGLKGSADILGIIKGGTFLAIEVKTGKAKQTTEQKNFELMILSFGGIYILANSVNDVYDRLNHLI